MCVFGTYVLVVVRWSFGAAARSLRLGGDSRAWFTVDPPVIHANSRVVHADPRVVHAGSRWFMLIDAWPC